MASQSAGVDVGSGLPIVFSHGTALDHTMFAEQIAAVREKHRAIGYDHYAVSGRTDGDYDLDDLVGCCLDIADRKTLDTFVLVGTSLGGFMAIEFALTYPDRLAGLVLIGTGAGAYSAEQISALTATCKILDSDGPVPETFIDWWTQMMWSARTLTERPELVEQWSDQWRKRPARTVWREFQCAIKKADRAPLLAEIKVPTLIVHGENDAALPLDPCGTALRDGIPAARFAVVPGTGHLAVLERPDLVNQELLHFLSTLHP
jgi:pimeloyl-ACP methyl ester carboxylesterase